MADQEHVPGLSQLYRHDYRSSGRGAIMTYQDHVGPIGLMRHDLRPIANGNYHALVPLPEERKSRYVCNHCCTGASSKFRKTLFCSCITLQCDLQQGELETHRQQKVQRRCAKVQSLNQLGTALGCYVP